MSDISLANLEFISREDLAKQLRASQQATPAAEASSGPSFPENLAIIDVRDGDHVGGHIRGSTWVPSSTLDYKSAELVRTLKDKEVVVFHCALSQQRGPGAALRYLREKQRLEAEGGEKAGEEGKGEEGEVAKEGKKVEQKVVVLKGGFTEWQEKYGPDERLTEKWQRDIWES